MDGEARNLGEDVYLHAAQHIWVGHDRGCIPHVGLREHQGWHGEEGRGAGAETRVHVDRRMNASANMLLMERASQGGLTLCLEHKLARWRGFGGLER